MKLRRVVFLLTLASVLVSVPVASIGITGPAATPVSGSVLSTPPAIREVTVALRNDIPSLYVYDFLSTDAQSILQALMDDPLTKLNYDYQPVLLTKLPSLEDGDIAIRMVAVQSGTRIADPLGNVLTYTGQITTMPQMVITFTMRSDIR